MTYTNVGDIKDSLKEDMALEFCRNRNKDFNVLTDTHINHHQIHHIRNNWLVPTFFSTGDKHTKRLLVLLYRDLEGVIDDDTGPKLGLMSFKITSSNDRVLCVYSPSRHNSKEQLSKGHFFEGLQNYMENKSDGNENKIMLGDHNCTVDKMDKDGGNKTQTL